jgi:alcohol dehydrogenase
MKRMVFVRPGHLEWEDHPDPIIEGAEEAIVRPIVMGRCDLDVLYVNGQMPLGSGEPIGHEIIGEVVSLGDAAAQAFDAGEIVMVAAQISCGRCRQCVRGQTGRCERVPLGASYGMGRVGGFGGAVSDLVKVPFAKAMMTKVPKNSDITSMIGLADMATDAWRAVGPQLEARPGGTVLVIGASVPVISLYAAGLAVCLGASRVVYIDDDTERMEISQKYGAEAYSNLEDVDNSIFDIVVDAGMDQNKLLQAIRACGPAGQLTSVAPPFVSPELPLLESYNKGLTWEIGRPNCSFGRAPALNAWSCCGFKPELVGPKVFDYEDAPEAWLDPAPYVAVQRQL